MIGHASRGIPGLFPFVCSLWETCAAVAEDKGTGEF